MTIFHIIGTEIMEISESGCILPGYVCSGVPVAIVINPHHLVTYMGAMVALCLKYNQPQFVRYPLISGFIDILSFYSQRFAQKQIKNKTKNDEIPVILNIADPEISDITRLLNLISGA